ncbi:zinc finger protein 469 [Notechis scutatus]|uniref:Zinc finger protein 469 n=1 Tax=Notechis scutatus TaxID=8663 RepID=A0A6J1VGR4_9SAUR|nr:zinc finger protein 469 [Notechis scutatus]
MGETQHVYATRDVESGGQDKVLGFEPFSKKDPGEVESRSELEGQSGGHNGADVVSNKEKEPQSQREAVIRPQKAGKIDFKSLNNRPRFSGGSPWGGTKGNPPSPPGRSRARDKSSRRAGRSERSHQQLYRLTLNNARPNPTIGIAYPQQKIMPPKKVEADRGPALGSNRFHAPSLPERDLKLSEEELSFGPCFSEAPTSHISSNYTSQAITACPGHGSKIQPLVNDPPENPGTKGQLPYLEFQANGSNVWPSPDKGYLGANNGLPAPKPSTHCLGPLSFQYPFSPLHSSASDPFQGEAHPQDYANSISLATSQASHGAFAFHSSSRDWKEEVRGNGSYDNVESRTYGLTPPPAPFHLPQAPGHLPCYKGRNGPSADHNGAISPSGAIDQIPSTFQENQAVFPPSLHASSTPKAVGKRHPSLSKDGVASQRILDVGSSLRRNGLPVTLPQVHFQSKASNEASSVVPFEKSLPASVQAHPQLLQAWEGGKKTYPPMEPSSAGCPSPGGSQVSFGYHSGLGKRAWQHLHLTSGVPGQNRLELSRKLASQKLPFPLSTSKWEESKKLPQSPTSYPSKALGGEDLAHQNCSSASGLCFEGSPEGETSKSKTFFLTMSPARPPIPSHHPPSPSLGLPPATLAPSPKGSPLSSPTPNLNSSCSSPSLTSSSPPGHSFEDEAALAASTFFHHQGHPKDGRKPFQASELLGASSVPYQVANPIKAFQQELLYKGVSVDSHFQKSNVDASKRCPEGFESELPPPPYPYSSSRHFLASSLSSTSLDQLDVFLTCKQCDQNFSNLSSFLEHRQFCGSHVVLPGQAKDSPGGAEVKKQHQASPEPAKHGQTSLGMLLPSDPHLQLLASNKTVDFLVDVEGKGESKDDPLKLNQLNGFPGNFLPLNTSDLEIDDAKLDSLITEALNGLGYQSDNPEIDSSFIDVFADEDLVSVKTTNAGTPFKAKESLTLGKKAKHVGMDESMKMLNCCDNHPSGELAKSKTSKPPKERGTNWLSDFGEERHETFKSTELPRNKAPKPSIFGAEEEDDASVQCKAGKKNGSGPFLPAKQGSQTRSDLRQTKNLPCASPRSELKTGGTNSMAESTTLSKKGAKKRKPRSGSWSKELIQKIVQQKNKFHKLHSQNSKAVSLSLFTNRLLPETKDNKFGEYEYMSESDDERVEYAKRHCRRKLGSRFSGQLRSGLSRRTQGRGGREKGTEPIWRYGSRRGEEEPKRLASKELQRTGGPSARVRRRSSRSSTSSCQSLSMSSETSNSPQSTERGDSDTERESEQRKRFLKISRCVGPLNVPENKTIRRSHGMSSNLPRKPTTVDPPQTQPVDKQKFQEDNPSIPQDTHLTQSREMSCPSEATAGKGPTVPLSPDVSDQYHGAFCGDSEHPRVMPKDTDGAEGHRCHPYTAGKGGILKNPAEEPTGSPSVGKHSISSEESTSYEQVDLEGLKNRQELIMPISCFGDNPGSRETSGKSVNPFLDAANAFYDCKELSHSYETPSLFSGRLTMGPPPNENAYLCQGDFDVPSFKEKHDSILPCESDHAQSKVSAPLHFDSSSAFLEFPIVEFDANLYDSVASSKDNYIPFECASHQLSKIIPFDQQYSSFLPEKDWTLMGDVSPILAGGTPPIPRLPVEKPIAKRPSSNISPLSLSDQLSEYNVHFMSGLSEDELEIKRLVTELESQLQANKLPLQAPYEDQASVNHLSLEAKESAHEFLSLRLDQEQEGKGLFLIEAGYENAKLLPTEPFSCENIASEKRAPSALETKYGSPNAPWPCAGSFSPLGSAPGLILVGTFSPQGHQDKTAENLKDIEISAEVDFGGIKNDSCLDEVSNSSRAPDYAEQVIQSPDSIFPESLEDRDLNPHENLSLRSDVFPKLLSEQKTCGSPTELESYGHDVSPLDPEFDLQGVDALESDENLSSSAQSKNPEKHPPEKLETTSLFQNNEDEHLGNNDETRSQTVCQTLMLNAKGDNGDTPHFDVLTFSKEVDGDVGFKSSTQEKAGNPLHQLQLFVARTVKNNEEELVSSSFPVQHPGAHLPTWQSLAPQPEEELMDKEPNEEVTSGPGLENKRENLLKETAKFPTKLLSEPEKETEPFGECASDVSKDSAPLNPAQYSKVVQQQHLKVECLEVNGHAMCAEGISPESDNLSPLSNSEAASVLSGGRAQQSPVTGLAKEDQEEKTLAFRDCRKSPLSPWSPEKKTPQGALSAVLQAQVGSCASWNSGDQELGADKVHQVEESEDQLQDLQLNMSLTPIYSPESQTERVHLLQRNDFSSANSLDSTEGHESEKQVSYYAEASQAGLSLVLGSADQKKVLKTRNATGSDFGGIPLEEIPGQIIAASQQVAFLMCSFPSVVEKKTAVPQPSPPRPKGCAEALPFFPSCDAISHLPPDMPGALAEDLNHALMEPQKNVPLGYSSSLCSNKGASSAAEINRPLNLQMSDCKSPSRLPLKSRKRPEEPSDYQPDEDKGMFSVREEPRGPQAVSIHDILLAPLPSGIDSVELRGGVYNENVSSTSKPQEAKDIGGDPQEESRDPCQSEYFQKDVNVEEMPVILLTQMADDTSRIPPRRSSSDSQDLGNRSNLKKEDSASNENSKQSSDCMEQSIPEDQTLRNYSKPGQSKARKRKGLQTACDICSISFRSKTGLIRHKAVKHQRKKDGVVLPDNNSAPLEKALKTSKVFPKKSVKCFIQEKPSNSDLSKAVGRSSPKASRRQKKAPKARGQEGISKELNGPNVIALDTAHEFQTTDEIQPTSSQAEKSDGSEIQSRKNTSTEKATRVAHTKRSSSYARRKTKEKPRQTKMTSDKDEVTASSLQESEVPPVHGNTTGITDDHILTTIPEEPGKGSEEQIKVSLPSLPQQSLTNELENINEKMPSAQRTVEPQLPQNVESHKEEGEELGQVEHIPERWPSGSVKEGEDEPNQKSSEKRLLEEVTCTSQNSPSGYPTSPNPFSPPCPPGTASETGSPKPTSEKALDAPCFVTPEPWKREEPQPPKEEPAVDPAVEPDLPSLFDDDATFSQLFPRNDEFARRKCTRVYGKRSKKPKAVSEIIAKPEGTPDLFMIRMASDLGENSSFCVTREDPCEYDTISIDDALMLNMCHGSQVTSGDVNSRPTKETALQLDTGQKEDDDDDLKNSGVFLCKESPTGSLPCFKSWDNLEKATENSSAEGPSCNSSVQLPCGHSAAEDNPELPDLKEKPHSTEEKTSSAFPTIDMEMLNMKFETGDVCFCPTGEDPLSPTKGGGDGPLGPKPTSLLRVKPVKHKLEEGKAGKTRNDLNLKNKDKQYKCKVCFQWFLTLGELDFHKLSHNPSPPPTCYMCVQRKFSSREQLRDHLKEKHAKNKAGLWACGMCLKEISEVWMYNEHLREHATQFARKGQAQKSVLGLGFSEEDAAVTHFLNSIICRKPSRFPKQAEGGNGAPAGSEVKGPKEFSGQEPAVHKDLPEIPTRIRPPIASLKVPAVPSPDPVPKVEGAQKSVPIHPECKDPSRDCHHCGKQFPKPFKLQRHLVVHSLQKIFLCHKCPMFYQETKELRSHLSQEHEIAEEADIKHTTLYACELCADVMHVIKKSFICSTCNYTFSKKEQYDRHMEKHLVGSSKTFRFRGVMRPGPFAKYGKKDLKEETRARAEAPAAKKKKVSHHHNSPELALPVHLDGAQASQEGSQTLPSAGEALSTATSLAMPPSAQPPMETEGPGRDFSSLLAERGTSPLHHLLPSLPLEPQDDPSSPEHITALSPETWADVESPGDNPMLLLNSPDALSSDLASVSPRKTAAAQGKLSLAYLSEKHNKEHDSPEKAIVSRRVEHNIGTWESPYLEDLASKVPKFSPENPGSSECKWSPEIQWSSNPDLNGTAPQETVSKLRLPETSFHELPLKDKASSSMLNRPAKEVPSKKVIGGQANADNTPGIPCSLDGAEEVQVGPLSKGKAFPEMDTTAHPKDTNSGVGTKETELNLVRPASGEAASAQSKNHHSELNKFPERPAANRLAGPHSKKPKEHNKSSHRGNSASRENIEGDGSKKRKGRSQDSVKGDHVKKVDWPTTEALAFSSRRRDTHANKQAPKLKVSVTDSQLRKLVLDQGFQKKVEIGHANGELRRKKEVLGSKALYPLLTKDPSASLPSSLNRRRAVQGAKVPTSHSYRTAESQTHLLNQLFGQKLTSFKIPLRRDTSE